MLIYIFEYWKTTGLFSKITDKTLFNEKGLGSEEMCDFPTSCGISGKETAGGEAPAHSYNSLPQRKIRDQPSFVCCLTQEQ